MSKSCSKLWKPCLFRVDYDDIIYKSFIFVGANPCGCPTMLIFVVMVIFMVIVPWVAIRVTPTFLPSAPTYKILVKLDSHSHLFLSTYLQNNTFSLLVLKSKYKVCYTVRLCHFSCKKSEM